MSLNQNQNQNASDRPRILIVGQDAVAVRPVLAQFKRAGAEPVHVPSAESAARNAKARGASAVIVPMDGELSAQLHHLRPIKIPFYTLSASAGANPLHDSDRSRHYGAVSHLVISSLSQQAPQVVRALADREPLQPQPESTLYPSRPTIHGYEVGEVEAHDMTDMTVDWGDPFADSEDADPPSGADKQADLSLSPLDHLLLDPSEDHETPDPERSADGGDERPSTGERGTALVSLDSGDTGSDGGESRAAAPGSSDSAASAQSAGTRADEDALRALEERLTETMVAKLDAHLDAIRQAAPPALRGRDGIIQTLRSIVHSEAHRIEERVDRKLVKATRGWEMRVHEIAAAVSKAHCEQVSEQILVQAMRLIEDHTCGQQAKQVSPGWDDIPCGQQPPCKRETATRQKRRSWNPFGSSSGPDAHEVQTVSTGSGRPHWLAASWFTLALGAILMLAYWAARAVL